jgi:hypothetical protein
VQREHYEQYGHDTAITTKLQVLQLILMLQLKLLHISKVQSSSRLFQRSCMQYTDAVYVTSPLLLQRTLHTVCNAALRTSGCFHAIIASYCCCHFTRAAAHI